MSEKYRELDTYESLYTFFTVSFCVLLVMSNVIAAKIFRIPFTDLSLPMGVVTYPATFLVTDIVSEIWGPQRANRVVYLGFFMNLLMLSLLLMAVQLPPSETWINTDNALGLAPLEQYQTAFASVFGMSATAFGASMIAYMVAQLIDIRIFHFVRKFTGDRFLWLRNNVSTCASQMVDTVIVSSIFLYYGMGMEFLPGLKIMATSYSFKLLFALIDTPFCYLGVAWVKKQLKEQPV